MQNSTRIIMNTGILYSKMFISIGIALFSTRLILEALGVDDFGIFALIGGVIGALSFLNKAMATATQRYLSYNRGKGSEAVAKVFNNALVLHILIGAIFVIMLEGAGIFLFDGFLNIPENRVSVAKFVYHCMVASTFFTVIAVPYDAIMNAKENMLAFALFSILESVLKLAIALFLYHTPADRLATYGLCMALMQLGCRTLKRIYSYKHYKETRVKIKSIDKNLIKEMASYSGWITIESLSHIAKGEGIPIILNLFFGTGVNAAYGVSTQVRQNIGFFSEMIFKASNPQVMRNIGEGNIQKSINLSTTVCKFSFLLMALLSVPLILEAPYILSVWLKKVPENAVPFCQLVLGTNLIIMLARGLNFLIDGIGKIKVYRISLTIFNLLVFPIAYGLLHIGAPPYSVFIGIFASDILVMVSRIYFAHRYSGMNVWHFLKTELIPLTFITCTILALLFKIKELLHVHPIAELCIITVTSTILLISGLYIFVLNSEEKSALLGFIKKLKNKIWGKR